MKTLRLIPGSAFLVAALVCVPASTAERFAVSGTDGEEVVEDRATGLIWTKQLATSVSWQEALAHCEGLSYADQDDWRLPNVNELRGLINRTVDPPASDFPDITSVEFWSSTTSTLELDEAWFVHFSQGAIRSEEKDSENNAICVRGTP